MTVLKHRIGDHGEHEGAESLKFNQLRLRRVTRLCYQLRINDAVLNSFEVSWMKQDNIEEAFTKMT